MQSIQLELIYSAQKLALKQKVFDYMDSNLFLLRFNEFSKVIININKMSLDTHWNWYQKNQFIF